MTERTSVTISPAPYTGSIVFLPEEINAHPYFKATRIAEWSLDGFLVSTGLTELYFLATVKTLARTKRLPTDVRNFARSLEEFFDGYFQQEVFEIAKDKAQKNINRALLSGKEHLLVQSHVTDVLENDKSELAECSNAHSAEPSTSSAPNLVKRKRSAYATEEPWRTLTLCLMNMVNGKKAISYPRQQPGMDPLHSLLFEHALKSLKEYEGQEDKDKDLILVKDAQVAMSCTLNTMSERACRHFEESNQEELVRSAKSLNAIERWDHHDCLTILKRYAPLLAKNGVKNLMNKVILDRGSIIIQHQDLEQLPPSAVFEDKVLQILTILCQFVLRPPFGDIPPSESDCLQLWVSVISVIVDKLTMHTGEKVLEASKVMRQRQTAEFDDVSESGRKVDLLFMYKGVEISNMEFKRPSATERDLAIQTRKNIRLARCMQEAHASMGVKKPSIMMADITGFVGITYQVRPMGDIMVAGETAAMMHLPRTRGGLEAFLEGSSLASLWNYIDRLEAQGEALSNAKERHEVELEKGRLARGVAAMLPSSSQPPMPKPFNDTVTLTPSKKRVKVQLLLKNKPDPPSPSERSLANFKN
ncbi:hypothetical protein BGZ75_000647 [Mortierella antarctica]|nr:hypothetical protein BGZ75_000647 [Mortierella antarctica]